MFKWVGKKKLEDTPFVRLTPLPCILCQNAALGLQCMVATITGSQIDHLILSLRGVLFCFFNLDFVMGSEGPKRRPEGGE